MKVKALAVLTAVLLLLAAPVFAQNLAVNGSFEVPTFPGWTHWWSPDPWYNFAVVDGLYFHQPDATNLPNNVLMTWDSIPDWTPSRTQTANEYCMTPWCDTSAGYDNAVASGVQFMKKARGSCYYSGIDQTLTGLTPGQTYEVSAWGTNTTNNQVGADMRILVDPTGGVDARVAPISSDPLPLRTGGRYWLYSSTGNDRIGTWVDTSASDVTGFYSLYDQATVQFTATSSTATIFLLADTANWDADDLGIAWDNVSVTAVPEPSGLVVAGLPAILAGLAAFKRRRS